MSADAHLLPPIPVRELVCVVFPRRSPPGLLAMLTAYFDESETQNATPKHFVISGYVGTERGWRDFERRWWKALVVDGFNKHGLHWTDLASGEDNFRHLKGEAHRKTRERLQRKYIAIIKRSHIAGMYAAFDVADFESALPVIAKLRPTKRKQHPYFHAFEMALNDLCRGLKKHGALQDGEKVAFVFDRKKEIEGLTNEIYETIAARTNSPVAEHFGSLTFAASEDFLPLQASDVLANEVKRELGRGDRPRRWQFDRLIAEDQVGGHLFTGEMFDSFAAKLDTAIAEYLAEKGYASDEP